MFCTGAGIRETRPPLTSCGWMHQSAGSSRMGSRCRCWSTTAWVVTAPSTAPVGRSTRSAAVPPLARTSSPVSHSVFRLTRRNNRWGLSGPEVPVSSGDLPRGWHWDLRASIAFRTSDRAASGAATTRATPHHLRECSRHCPHRARGAGHAVRMGRERRERVRLFWADPVCLREARHSLTANQSRSSGFRSDRHARHRSTSAG